MPKKPRPSKRLIALKELAAKVEHFEKVLASAEEHFTTIAETTLALTCVVEYMRQKMNITEDELRQYTKEIFYKQQLAKIQEETGNPAGAETEAPVRSPWMDGDEHSWGRIPEGASG